jgi:hypothetical protein
MVRESRTLGQICPKVTRADLHESFPDGRLWQICRNLLCLRWSQPRLGVMRPGPNFTVSLPWCKSCVAFVVLAVACWRDYLCWVWSGSFSCVFTAILSHDRNTAGPTQPRRLHPLPTMRVHLPAPVSGRVHGDPATADV